MTRRITLDFRPIGRHVAQLHQARLGRQAHHLHKHVLERLQMQLAKITDGAKVRTLRPHNGDKGQIAFAGQGNLPARKHPDAVGIKQQADHHRRVVGWGAPGFVLIRRIEAA